MAEAKLNPAGPPPMIKMSEILTVGVFAAVAVDVDADADADSAAALTTFFAVDEKHLLNMTKRYLFMLLIAYQGDSRRITRYSSFLTPWLGVVA